MRTGSVTARYGAPLDAAGQTLQRNAGAIVPAAPNLGRVHAQLDDFARTIGRCVMRGMHGATQAATWVVRGADATAIEEAARTSFARFGLEVGGLPVAALRGLDQLIPANAKHYSPLHGLIFSVDHLIPNLYAHGDAGEPAVALLRALFHAPPGDAPTPSNLGANPGAHLEPGTIGRLIAAFERVRRAAIGGPGPDLRAELTHAFADVLATDPGYAESLSRRRIAVHVAREAFDGLRSRYEDGLQRRERAKRIEAVDLAPLYRSQRKLKKAGAAAEPELAALRDRIAALEGQVRALRAGAPNEAELRAGEQQLRFVERSEDVDSETFRAKEAALAGALATSFSADLVGGREALLYPRLTTAILLAYLWQKAGDKGQLHDYYAGLAEAGIVSATKLAQTAPSFWEERFDAQSYAALARAYLGSWRKQKFVGERPVESLALALDKPSSGRPAPVVPWAPAQWAAYSTYPDCAENAIRNLIGQLIFDRRAQRYSADRLRTLQAEFPALRPELIAFFAKYPDPASFASDAAAAEWLTICEGFNARVPAEPPVRFRRDGRRELGGSFANSELVLHRLLGLTGEPAENWTRLTAAVERAGGPRFTADRSRLDAGGFGVFTLTDGTTAWPVTSKVPIHVASQPAIELAAASQPAAPEAAGAAPAAPSQIPSGAIFGVFRDLLYASTRGKPARDEAGRQRQLAYASLFFPCAVARGRVDGLLADQPAHHALLFADLSTPEARARALALVPEDRLSAGGARLRQSVAAAPSSRSAE